MPKLPQRTYPDLKTYFEKSGETQWAFARRLKRSQAWVSRVANGLSEPSLDEAMRVSELAGVPLESLVVRRRAHIYTESAASDNECYVVEKERLTADDSRITPTELQAAVPGESSKLAGD